MTESPISTTSQRDYSFQKEHYAYNEEPMYPPGEPSARVTIGRPRSKSKPTEIFIHPAESNLARADAAALQLGLAGDTSLVKGNIHSVDGNAAWKMGEGKDMARQIMSRGSI